MENRQVREEHVEESSHAPLGHEGMHPPFGMSSRGGRLEDPLGPVRTIARRWRLLAVLVIVGLSLIHI